MIQEVFEKRFKGDHPPMISLREYLAKACADFIESGLADSMFSKELLSDDDQKFWARISEALVARLLSQSIFGARAKFGEGPDFLVMNGTSKVWIEVVCPEPVDIPLEWLNLEFGNVVQVPNEKILLRWMSAIKSKAEKLIGSSDGLKQGYINSKIVGPDDAYVIAVNACRLRNGPFPGILGISQFPFAAEAVFSIGPYGLQIDSKSLEVIDRGHQYRPHVLNKNGSKVPADTFFDPRFNPISAIWALDLNGGTALGNKEPVVVVHNPNATNPLPMGFLTADDEYIATQTGDGFILKKHSCGSPHAS